MGHEWESGFVLREPAWHGLATVVDEALNAMEAIRMAGLDWLVVKETCHRPDGRLIPGSFSTVRLKDDKILGKVGSVYEPIQNGEMFTFFDSVFDREDGRYYHTGGSLKGGKVVWLLAKLPGDFYVVPDDRVENYILLASSHDMSIKLLAKHTPIRVVCNNTLSMALGHASLGASVSIKHTRNYALGLMEASRVLGLAQKRIDVMRDVAMDLARRQINRQGVGEFLEAMFPAKLNKKGKTPKQTLTKRSAVENLFANSETNNLPGIQGTKWAMYNAVTEFVDHDMPTRGNNADAGFRSWFGTGEAMKVKASGLLMGT